MTVEEVNKLFEIVMPKSKNVTGNFYLLLIDSIEEIQMWLNLWDKNEDGSYYIAGNNTFVIESPLNILIDITDKF